MNRKAPTHPCRLVSITGAYLTPNGTFSTDPSQALTAERWWIDLSNHKTWVLFPKSRFPFFAISYWNHF